MSDPRDTAPRCGSWGLRSWAGLIAALSIYFWQVALYVRHLNDDAFITFRYSRFLASGHGPYFNIGEHVEGYTNFLHMLIMAAVYALTGEAGVPAAAKILGVLAGGMALIFTFLIARQLASLSPELSRHRALAGGLASGLVAVFPGYAVNSTSGLETTTFAALLTLGAYLGVRARVDGGYRGGGMVWAVATLTRPEGVAIFGVHSAASAVTTLLGKGERLKKRWWRSWLIDVGIVATVLIAHIALRYALYDGELLPNTYHAKAEGFGGEQPWNYVRRGILAPFLGPLGVAVGLVGWRRGGAMLKPGVPLIAVALFGALLPFMVGADWMPGWRFAVPYLPLMSVTVTLGWLLVLRPVIAWRRHLGPVLAVLIVAAMGVAFHAERRDLAEHLNLRAAGYVTGHLSLADWIRGEIGDREGPVALMDIGMVGYYCPEQRILDITGLTDRHIAKSPGRLLKKRYDPSYILDRRPEVIVLALSAVADPRARLPEDAPFGTWIDIENKIYTHPGFERYYKRVRPPDPAAPLTERLAARFGAERVFEHAHPDQFYFLAAYLRRDESPGSRDP